MFEPRPPLALSIELASTPRACLFLFRRRATYMAETVRLDCKARTSIRSNRTIRFIRTELHLAT